jgi:3-deoxy-D-manno-octulosonate 8-phosphate phosphatase (KDO 8-P phosphatase)
MINYDLSKIRAIIFDVDGVLSAETITLSPEGEPLRTVNIKDGYALAHLLMQGIEPIIITGRSSEIVKRRCEELGIKELHQGVADKAKCLKEVCEKKGITTKQCAYIGDDVNDIDCMMLCGHKAAPSDAMKVVRDVVDYVCEARGGEGAVREYCDYLIEKTHKK